MGVEITTSRIHHRPLPRSYPSNAYGLLRLPIMAYLAPEDDRVFNLIARPNPWHLDPDPIQKRLQAMSSNPQIKDGVLYKLVRSSRLPYINLLSCTNFILKDHLQVGHGVFKNTY